MRPYVGYNPASQSPLRFETSPVHMTHSVTLNLSPKTPTELHYPPPNFDRTAVLRLHGHAGRLLHKRHQHPGGRERPRGGPVGGDRALTAGAQPDRAGRAAARHPSVLSVPAAAVHRRQSGPALPQLVRRGHSPLVCHNQGWQLV